MQLRENFANDHEAMSRTQLQRVYEILYFRDVYARTNGRDQATAANIAAEYAKVRMARGRERISKSFVDTALTIHARLLAIPAAERLLLEMGSSDAGRDHVDLGRKACGSADQAGTAAAPGGPGPDSGTGPPVVRHG
jgi:hypothetical protein